MDRMIRRTLRRHSPTELETYPHWVEMVAMYLHFKKMLPDAYVRARPGGELQARDIMTRELFDVSLEPFVLGIVNRSYGSIGLIWFWRIESTRPHAIMKLQWSLHTKGIINLNREANPTSNLIFVFHAGNEERGPDPLRRPLGRRGGPGPGGRRGTATAAAAGTAAAEPAAAGAARGAAAAATAAAGETKAAGEEKESLNITKNITAREEKRGKSCTRIKKSSLLSRSNTHTHECPFRGRFFLFIREYWRSDKYYSQILPTTIWSSYVTRIIIGRRRRTTGNKAASLGEKKS